MAKHQDLLADVKCWSDFFSLKSLTQVTEEEQDSRGEQQ